MTSLMKFLTGSLIALVVTGCGIFEEKEPPTQPAPEVNIIVDDPDNPGAPGPQPGQRPSYSQVQAIIQGKCISCHPNDKFVQSEEGLLASRAWELVKNNMMPPGAPLAGSDRTTFLNFFSGNVSRFANELKKYLDEIDELVD